MLYLGIDTSNYTTSCALYDSADGSVAMRSRLLPVKAGERGIRQSDAVFHHTANLHTLLGPLMQDAAGEIAAFGVSDRPRDAEGSYMPCFSVGFGTASSLAAVTGKPLYRFSHQAGHIMAALYSSGATELADRDFLAFHVSGGTTELLYVTPDSDRGFSVKIAGKTLDLNAGQVIDRVGVKLGLSFPCGRELEKLALESGRKFSPRVSIKGGDCCLSGAENLCCKMIDGGESAADVAAFCLEYIGSTVELMTENAFSDFGDIPVVFAGGVMSDKIIRERLSGRFGAHFAQPEFSCDNAAGIAILAYRRGT